MLVVRETVPQVAVGVRIGVTAAVNKQVATRQGDFWTVFMETPLVRQHHKTTPQTGDGREFG
jgi:hypothetical protein